MALHQALERFYMAIIRPSYGHHMHFSDGMNHHKLHTMFWYVLTMSYHVTCFLQRWKQSAPCCAVTLDHWRPPGTCSWQAFRLASVSIESWLVPIWGSCHLGFYSMLFISCCANSPFFTCFSSYFAHDGRLSSLDQVVDSPTNELQMKYHEMLYVLMTFACRCHI